MDGIHPNYGTNLVQGAVAPVFNLVPHLLGDVTYGLLGNLTAIVLFDEVTNLLHALTTSIKADDLIGKTPCKDRLTLPNGLRGKATITVTGRLHFYGTILGLHLLTHLAIMTVATEWLSLLKIAIQLTFHGRIEEILQYLMKGSFLPSKGLPALN